MVDIGDNTVHRAHPFSTGLDARYILVVGNDKGREWATSSVTNFLSSDITLKCTIVPTTGKRLPEIHLLWGGGQRPILIIMIKSFVLIK